MRVLRGRFRRRVAPPGEDPAQVAAGLKADLEEVIRDLEDFQETWRSAEGLNAGRGDAPEPGEGTARADGRRRV
jgi:hypothetical protein